MSQSFNLDGELQLMILGCVDKTITKEQISC